MALYRKTLQAPSVPTTVGVLWGDEIAGIRRIVEIGKTVGAIQSKFNNHHSKNLDERNRLSAGTWILKTYTNLTDRQYIELSEGTATLVSGALTTNNSELIEE